MNSFTAIEIINNDQGRTDITNDEVFAAYQHLVDSGLAWQLEGAIGRMAATLIELGYIEPNTNY
tara:strand:+ start:1798 stop:1989 length:192 start_codon:yes stop_codon:yes gene_type:complete